MENTTQKVNVKEIMDRANKKTESVKESTEKIQSKVDNFKVIPGFSKYEFNGNIIRNCKTKSILSLKSKNNKYQMISDEGKNCDRTKEQIKALFPAEIKTEKIVKEPKVKKEKVVKEKKSSSVKNHHIPNPLPLDQLKDDARKIMTFPEKSYNQIIKLFECGYSKEEIISITGKRNDVVSKYLRPFFKRNEDKLTPYIK